MVERKGLIAPDVTDAFMQAFVDTANQQPQVVKGRGTGCADCETDSIVRTVIDIARTTENFPGPRKPRTPAGRVQMTRNQAVYVADQLALHMPLMAPWTGNTPGVFERTKELIMQGRPAYKPQYRK